MAGGTASAKLKKALMFHMAKRLNEHYCFQCGLEIESIEDFTIEHKIPWMNSENPTKLFFSLDNIAFSHCYCNIKAARHPTKILSLEDEKFTHGNSGYGRGCRCQICKNWKVIENKRNRK